MVRKLAAVAHLLSSSTRIVTVEAVVRGRIVPWSRGLVALVTIVGVAIAIVTADVAVVAGHHLWSLVAGHLSVNLAACANVGRLPVGVAGIATGGITAAGVVADDGVSGASRLLV